MTVGGKSVKRYASSLNYKCKVNADPSFSTDCTWILPLCRSRICWQRLSPIPLPFFRVLKNGINILSMSEGGMPQPLSATLILILLLPAANAASWMRGFVLSFTCLLYTSDAAEEE